MKPVAIFRHSPTEGPGYFATYLHARGLPWQLVKLDEGEGVPAGVGSFSGLVFMGGPMSVNDDLPWIAPVLELIRKAVPADVPVLGHCLGGQLMARALGAQVLLSPVPEVGWHEVQMSGGAEQKKWFGAAASATVFQWHYDAFELPPEAVHLAGNTSCPNQAFSLGPHLAMQFHLEIDANKLDAWLTEPEPSYQHAQQQYPSVQSVANIRDGTARFLIAQQALADRIYAQWMSSARR